MNRKILVPKKPVAEASELGAIQDDSDVTKEAGEFENLQNSAILTGIAKALPPSENKASEDAVGRPKKPADYEKYYREFE